MITIETLADLKLRKARDSDGGVQSFSDAVYCRELRAIMVYKDLGASAPTANNNTCTITGDGGSTRWLKQLSFSGTYTPTMVASSDTNITASTISASRFMQVGNMVHVSGRISITPTAALAASTSLSLTLPLAQTLGAATLVGVGSVDTGTTTQAVSLSADTGNNAVKIKFFALLTGAQVVTYSFSYDID